MKMDYYVLKIKNCVTVYDSIENLVEDIQLYYYDYNKKIELQKVYNVYAFKSENLQGTQIFVDKKTKELLDVLNNKSVHTILDKKEPILYYLACGIDNTLTEACRECVTEIGIIWKIIHNNTQ